MNHTANLIHSILTNAKRFEWSIQGLGMLRLYLDGDCRLHVWSKAHIAEAVTPVHDHPWDFDSTIISGSLTNLIYQPREQGLPYFKQRILCGPGGGIDGEPTPIGLICTSRQAYGPGDSYAQKAEVIHESMPEDGCVTLIKRTQRPDTEHANVFYESGKIWVSAEPRDATPSEVAWATRNALAKWNP